MWKIPLFDLNYDDTEEKAVMSVVKSKWLSSGKKTELFEKEFEEYLGNGTMCIAVANCTASLHMSLLLLNIGSGDEVIISGLTFVAAVNVVTLTGAIPVLADSKSLTDWNVSPADIERKITPRTKAVIIVHYAGYPCDLDDITRICQKNKLSLIEDTAHAVGAEYKGQKCGSFGNFSCFSFFSNKNLSTGEGGMLVTKEKGLYHRARLLRSHGMTSMTIDRHRGKSISYDVMQPGFNYRFDEIRSALGRVQLKKLDKSNAARKRISIHYNKCLQGMNSLIIPFKEPHPAKQSSYHIFPVLLPHGINRLTTMNILKTKGIQTSIHYPAFKDFTYYKHILNYELPVAESISERVLTLPLYPTMTFTQVELVCDELIKALK